MNNEVNNEIELTAKRIYQVGNHSDNAAKAFAESIIGTQVQMLVDSLGWIDCEVMQASNYVYVVKQIGDNDGFMQISKSHIIAIRADSGLEPEFNELVVKGVKRIMFKHENRPANKPFKPKGKAPAATIPSKPKVEEPTVPVIVKPKRKLVLPPRST